MKKNEELLRKKERDLKKIKSVSGTLICYGHWQLANISTMTLGNMIIYIRVLQNATKSEFEKR